MRSSSKQLVCIGILLFFHAANAEDPLTGHVTVYRDDYGTPHIVGDSEEATFFGYGHAQAEDHLERMMLQYRDAQGRRAEVLGFEALGDGYLHFIPYEYRWDGDYLQRLLRTKQAVLDHRGQIAPETYRILDAFARGVNAYIAEHRAGIPAWIDRVTAEDIEALERSNYLRFYSIHDALIKLQGGTYSLPDLGSNQWAIAPGKSASGRIIHVEHTHMPWANRFQNYEAHLMTPGRLNAAGISWFGSPFFLDGFNDRITWSATWNEPNISDVYEEKLNPENPRQYLYDGHWRDLQRTLATFRVKGPKGMESVTLALYYTHHGPVVKTDQERHRAWSVKLPNFDGVNYSTGMYGLMKARNLKEFQAAVARQLLPRWNLLYTDAREMFWVHNGNVARRAAGYDWSRPVPGWTSETEWGAYLPFEAYPQLTNPASGFLQNCNNPPWVATRHSGLRPLDPAPYYLLKTPSPQAGEEALNTRGERLFQVLSQNRKFSLAEMQDLAFDTYVLPADVIIPLLEQASKNLAPSPEARGAMEKIRAWDRRSSVQSIAFTYLHFWGKTYGDLFSADSFERFNGYRRSDINLHSREEQRRALAALEEAIHRIQKHFGKSEVPWGQVNVLRRGGTFPMDGTDLYGVLHPDEGVSQDNGQISCNDGWGHLMIVMEGDPKQVWSLLPYGESEHPDSRHFNDQAKLHTRRQVKRFWYTPTEILAHTESVSGRSSPASRARSTMKITQVEALHLRLPQVEEIADGTQDVLVIRIHTDAGLTGIGEVSSQSYVCKAIFEAERSAERRHGLAYLLRGQDPLDVEGLWQRLYQHTNRYGRRGAVIHAISGADLALWDLRGKALGKPVYELLGDGRHKSIRAYASYLFGATPQETGELARQAVDLGLTAMKFGWGPFGQDLSQDLAHVEAARRAAGESRGVMVDAGLKFQVPAALERARLLEPLRIGWLEEPLSQDDLKGYSELCAESPIPIAAGEGEVTHWGFEDLIERGVRVLQPDVAICGGLTVARQASVLAKTAGRRCVPHCFSTGINLAASLHWMAALGSDDPLVEYCLRPSPLMRKLVRNLPPLVEGYVPVPQAPGLGIELDEEIIGQFRVT